MAWALEGKSIVLSIKVGPEPIAYLYPHTVDICYLLPVFPLKQTSTQKRGLFFHLKEPSLRLEGQW